MSHGAVELYISDSRHPFHVYATDLHEHPVYPSGSLCLSSKTLESRRDIKLTEDFCIVLTPEMLDELASWIEAGQRTKLAEAMI